MCPQKGVRWQQERAQDVGEQLVAHQKKQVRSHFCSSGKLRGVCAEQNLTDQRCFAHISQSAQKMCCQQLNASIKAKIPPSL